MDDLFTPIAKKAAPLSDRMRPASLAGFIGQEHIVGEGRLLRRAIMTDTLQSSIFYGPPGCGKTTLAHIIASTTGSAFEKLNAVTDGVKELREVIARAESRLKLNGKSTYLLLDECHRWNKAQSDAILPALESGVLRFIGSTTENPMVAMTGAIVSRCRVFEFKPLSTEHVKTALMRALTEAEKGLGGMNVVADDEAIDHIARVANGDIRVALNALELAALTTPRDADGTIRITPEIAADSIQSKITLCGEDEYYDMLSAFCKSLRGSDSDAAMYWFSRLIRAGVDPKLIARRLIVHASEDVGLANPQAMVQAVAAANALQFVGLPEAKLPLAQAIIYICESAKSNSVIVAIERAARDADETFDCPVSLHLKDAHYAGAEKLGRGANYKYPHDYPGHYVVQQYLPDNLLGKVYYQPSDQGSEKAIKQIKEKRRERSL
ncbi:MAG: replication-associated recombination protein A [Christensenellales bacterium]|jgi:putative ATPase